MEDFGGYDYDFIDSVQDRYKCAICTKVFRDPELTVCCGQHYCGTCLVQWFTKQHKTSCPYCRTEGSKFQHVENKGLKSEISQLKISCSNKCHGCEWTGELGELNDHLKRSGESGCSYAEIECPNKCGVKVIRNNLASHIITECSQRQEKCQYCGKQDTFAAIAEHKILCPNFPLVCPNDCDSDLIEREKMLEHLKICPKRKQDCPFEEAGCTVSLKPGDLETHMESCMSQHMQMLAIEHKEMKDKTMKMESELKSMQEKQAKEKETVKKLKQSLIFELRALDGSVHGGMKNAAYEAIETILEEESDIMNKPEPTAFRLLNFSQLARSSTTWYSAPFTIQHYKLCLAVHPRGLGSGFQSHASLSLILLEVRTAAMSEGPTFSSLLSSIHVLIPILKLGPGKHHRVYLSGICGGNIDLSPLTEGEDKRILGTQEEWITHEAVSQGLWNDSLIVKIERAEERSSFDEMQAALMRHAMNSGRRAECNPS